MATSNDELDVREIYKSKFLVGEDLDGGEVTCGITKAGLQTLQGDDGEPETKIKLALQPTGQVTPEVAKAFRKPLVLCKKEANKLARLMGTPKARGWIGGTITLYPMPGRFFGVEQVVPRVRDKVVKPGAAQQQAPARTRQPGED